MLRSLGVTLLKLLCFPLLLLRVRALGPFFMPPRNPLAAMPIPIGNRAPAVHRVPDRFGTLQGEKPFSDQLSEEMGVMKGVTAEQQIESLPDSEGLKNVHAVARPVVDASFVSVINPGRMFPPAKEKSSSLEAEAYFSNVL